MPAVLRHILLYQATATGKGFFLLQVPASLRNSFYACPVVKNEGDRCEKGSYIKHQAAQ